MNKGEMAIIVLITANKLKVFSNIFAFTYCILNKIVAICFWYNLIFIHSLTNSQMEVMNLCAEKQ